MQEPSLKAISSDTPEQKTALAESQEKDSKDPVAEGVDPLTEQAQAPENPNLLTETLAAQEIPEIPEIPKVPEIPEIPEAPEAPEPENKPEPSPSQKVKKPRSPKKPVKPKELEPAALPQEVPAKAPAEKKPTVKKSGPKIPKTPKALKSPEAKAKPPKRPKAATKRASAPVSSSSIIPIALDPSGAITTDKAPVQTTRGKACKMEISLSLLAIAFLLAFTATLGHNLITSEDGSTSGKIRERIISWVLPPPDKKEPTVSGTETSPKVQPQSQESTSTAFTKTEAGLPQRTSQFLSIQTTVDGVEKGESQIYLLLTIPDSQGNKVIATGATQEVTKMAGGEIMQGASARITLRGLDDKKSNSPEREAISVKYGIPISNFFEIQDYAAGEESPKSAPDPNQFFQ